MPAPLENLIRTRKEQIGIRFLGRIFLTGIKKTAFFFIKLYQEFISPNFGTNCRFYPSCSEYCRQAIEKYGLVKGIWLGMKRIIKCNPWHQGGIDLPR